jgi:hypothetical protein
VPAAGQQTAVPLAGWWALHLPLLLPVQGTQPCPLLQLLLLLCPPLPAHRPLPQMPSAPYWPPG